MHQQFCHMLQVWKSPAEPETDDTSSNGNKYGSSRNHNNILDALNNKEREPTTSVQYIYAAFFLQVVLVLFSFISFCNILGLILSTSCKKMKYKVCFPFPPKHILYSPPPLQLILTFCLYFQIIFTFKTTKFS